jgi:hypothetical protein
LRRGVAGCDKTKQIGGKVGWAAAMEGWGRELPSGWEVSGGVGRAAGRGQRATLVTRSDRNE